MITSNDENINNNIKDTDIQNSNEILTDNYETVQGSSNPDPINDSTNITSTHNNKESTQMKIKSTQIMIVIMMM